MVESFYQFGIRQIEIWTNLVFPREISFDKKIANLQGYIPDFQGSLDSLSINSYTHDTCQY